MHTHIYPKYKTKRAFSVATVNFCEWLRNTIRSYDRPLDTIDVVLLGHSMGGSLASEAIILLSRITFKHNVVGIIGLDCPFLGVHPHVVTSGVAGLVKPTPPAKVTIPLDRLTADSDSIPSNSTLSIPDTLYSETNSSQSSVDLTLPRRTPSPTPSPRPEGDKKSNFKKTFTKTVTAIYNHRHDLGSAGPRYLWSHLEYGHILLDPAELKTQYDQLRKLPIQFVNYYTCVQRKGTDKRGRVFCSLPESVGRSMDGWEAIEMEPEMDEPTAHSAIFAKEYFRGYWNFVECMTEKISSWE